jgi:hypothetical protein
VILNKVEWEIMRYAGAIYEPNSKAIGLEIRSNSQTALDYFDTLLTYNGFILCVDGFTSLKVRGHMAKLHISILNPLERETSL